MEEVDAITNIDCYNILCNIFVLLTWCMQGFIAA